MKMRQDVQSNNAASAINTTDRSAKFANCNIVVYSRESNVRLCKLDVFQVCFAFDTGYIPPNLHYENPREDIPALTKGRMTVVSEKTKFNRGLFGINSFGFGGANAHILLKNLAKEKVFFF